MLLRRMTEHVKDQNWLAVGIDFFIVVLGVFIGLQVSNWNDAQADKRLEREYLERLYADMVGGVADHREDAAWDQERLRTQDVVLAALQSGALADEDRDDFARGLTFVGIHNPIRRRWGTVEELTSTGNIALLRDIELRDMIAMTEASYRRMDRIVTAQETQLALLRADLIAHYRPVEYGLGLTDPIAATFDFNALSANEAFLNTFANADLASSTVVTFVDGHMNEIERLRDRLAEILEIDDGSAPDQ